MGEGMVRGSNPPPVVRHEPQYPVGAPGPGEEWEVVVLSSTLIGVALHWIRDSETGEYNGVLCPHPWQCEALCGPVARRWCGFLPVVRMPGWERTVLRMGPATGALLLTMARARPEMFGMVIRVGRPARERTAALTILPGIKLYPGAARPFDPLPTIRRYYGVELLPFEVEVKPARRERREQ